MRRLAISLLVILTMSCQSPDFFRKDIPSLRGRAEEQLIHEFGEPTADKTNTVEQFAQSPERWHQPTQAVLALYPANTPANLSVQIRSLSWQQDRIMITAWLHMQSQRWVVFYAEKWNMDVIE